MPDPLGRRQWLSAAIVGTSLLLGGNGLVSIAEQRIASGVAAVVIATVPIWAALAAALLGQERVTPRHAVGLLLGFAGVCALVLGTGGGTVRVSGVLLSLLAALSWAAGSVYARSAPLARRPLVMTAMQMLCGGVACLAAGALAGEAADLHLAAVPARSWIAVAFLVLLGSMLAYTAYAWLLLNARLSLVTTYAYVNPVVAVLLGTLLLDEAFTTRTLIASVTIVTGVALIVSRGGQRVRRPSGAPERDSSEERAVAAVRPRAASDEERPVR